LTTRKILREKYTSISPHYVSLVTSTLLDPNLLLSTLFPNILSLRLSLNVSDQVSHPYKTGKIIVLYIFNFKVLDSKLEDKDSAPNDSKHALGFNLLLIYFCIEF